MQLVVKHVCCVYVNLTEKEVDESSLLHSGYPYCCMSVMISLSYVANFYILSISLLSTTNACMVQYPFLLVTNALKYAYLINE